MEIRKLIDLLRATIDPNQRQQAEAQLDQVRKTCARFAACFIPPFPSPRIPDLTELLTPLLLQIHKIIGFAPSLLQVVILADCDMPVRQAGAIYLKNLITQNWQDREAEPGQPIPFALHEQDRALIRDSIVDAVVHAPDLIRTQLCTCVHHIVKYDFPGRWTQIVDKVTLLENFFKQFLNGFSNRSACICRIRTPLDGTERYCASISW